MSMLTRCLAVLCLVLTMVSSGWAAVANDGSGTPNVNSVSATSISLTTFTVGSGANRCLVAMLSFSLTTVSAISVTWDGTAMTQAATYTGTDATLKVITQLYVLINPTSGNKTLTASWTGASVVTLAAVEFSGADQVTCYASADNVTGEHSADPDTLTITSTTDGATVALTGNNFAFYTAVNQTEIYRGSDNGLATDASYALGGTSNTHTFTINDTRPADHVGIHILAVTAAGGVSRKTLTGAGK
jgi:hypothetical protein